jgi:hypothetical protein
VSYFGDQDGREWCEGLYATMAAVRHQWMIHVSRTDLMVDAARASLGASNSSESPYQWQVVSAQAIWMSRKG